MAFGMKKVTSVTIIINQPPVVAHLVGLRIYGLLLASGIFCRLSMPKTTNHSGWKDEKLKRKNLRKQKKLKRPITELKATQAQLIQSEKMASLGELTAGIAHEIQNPLNFVNNFSEVTRN